jgi:membrane-bound ClpP family serine protease
VVKPVYLASVALRAISAFHLSPDIAILSLTLGLLLIYLELNRPGTILPGAIGLLIVLLAIAALLPLPLSATAVALLAAGTGLLLLSLVRKTSILLAVTATLALIFGFLHIPGKEAAPRVHALVATGCGLILGAGTSYLTHLARRARANKGLDLEGARTSRPGALKS